MSEPVMTAHDALRWCDTTARHWRKLLTEHPELLKLGCDVARTATVGELLQHIVAVQLRYAERILGSPETEYRNIVFGTADEIFATHDRSIKLLHQALDSDLDWEAPLAFTTRTYGAAKASLKTIFFHSIFHGIRHYAQLSTLARQNGYQIDWPGDYLFMGATRG
jgi:uncharacterized damage-inducible protein DinB